MGQRLWDASAVELRWLARLGLLTLMWLMVSDMREPARFARSVAARDIAPGITRPATASAAQLPATVTLMPELERVLSQHVWSIEHVGVRERVIVGSLRAEVTGDRIDFADDRFGFPIVGAARVGSSWLFVTADGVVARAESFLGALAPLGQVPQPYWEAWPEASLQLSRGRLAVPTQDPHASLWTTDGSAPIAAAGGAPKGVVASAAFVDASHGMIVVDGGELWVTRDGAASFARVDLGDHAATTVVARDGELEVATSTGVVVFDRDGNEKVRGVSPTTSGPRRYDRADAPLFDRLFVAIARRYGALFAESFGWVVTAEGSVLVPVEDELRPLAALSDSEIAVFRHLRRCYAARWGKDYAVACDERSWVRVDAKTLQPTRTAADAHRALTSFMPDGVHAAWRCDVTHTDAQLCMASAYGVRKRSLRSPREQLIGGHGHEVVVAQPGNVLVRVDASTGVERALAVHLPADLKVTARHPWRISGDGAIAFTEAMSTRGEVAYRLVRVALSDASSSSDDAVTTVRLPDGARYAGFIDANRGVALDDDQLLVWITIDGGARWQAHGGFAGRAELPQRMRRRGAAPEWYNLMQCAGARCAIGGTILVAFDGSSAVARDRVLARPGASRHTDRDELPGPPRPAAGLVCAMRDRTWPAREADDLDDMIVQQQNPNVTATLRAPAERRWDATWHGTDARGPYRTRHAGGEAGILHHAGDDDTSYDLRSATRDGIVISSVPVWRPGPDDGTDRFGLFWLPTGGRTQQIASERPELAQLEDTLALPDGRLAVLVSLSEPGGRAAEALYHQLIVVDRTRGVIARRTYAWHYRNVGIAWFDGDVGVQWAESDPLSPHWFLPISGAPAIAEPTRIALASTPICGLHARAAVSAIAVEDVWAFEPTRSPELPIARVYLRGGARPCIQAVELRDPRVIARDIFLTPSSNGDLHTSLALRDVDTHREMRCALEAAPDQYVSALGHEHLQYAWSEYRETPAWREQRLAQERAAAADD